jgi:hypothetical protein
MEQARPRGGGVDESLQIDGTLLWAKTVLEMSNGRAEAGVSLPVDLPVRARISLGEGEACTRGFVLLKT